jgi:two-component system chemotaxis response regulator CheY
MNTAAPGADTRSVQGMGVEPGPILVVEDDDDIRDFVELALRNEGYAVEGVPNGAIALQSVERARPRAIILDMKMPVMDGWAFARQYHQLKDAEAPIIVMTAAHDPLVRAAQVRAFHVLLKPFDLVDLLEVVARAIRRTT